MLGTRILTAVILISVVLAALLLVAPVGWGTVSLRVVAIAAGVGIVWLVRVIGSAAFTLAATVSPAAISRMATTTGSEGLSRKVAGRSRTSAMVNL